MLSNNICIPLTPLLCKSNPCRKHFLSHILKRHQIHRPFSKLIRNPIASILPIFLDCHSRNPSSIKSSIENNTFSFPNLNNQSRLLGSICIYFCSPVVYKTPFVILYNSFFGKLIPHLIKSSLKTLNTILVKLFRD